jgi:hypothetical protein
MFYENKIAGVEETLGYYWGIFNDYVAETFPEVIDEAKLDEMIDLAQAMIENYIMFSEGVDTEYEILATEQELEAAIPGTDTILVGTCDLVLRSRKTLTTWIVDHKNVGQFAKLEYLELSDQITAYLWLAQQNGINATGVIYNELRKKKQEMPDLLKNGSLSKNKSIDTSADMYLKKILQCGLDPTDYIDILDKLETNEFVRRNKIIRSPQHIAQFEKQLAEEMKDIERGDLVFYPNPTPDCLWDCSYKILCMAQNDGGDVSTLIDNLYVVGEGRS